MDITAAFVVPPDAVLRPVSMLPAQVRLRAGAGHGDWTLFRPGSRARPRLISADAAAMLRLFHRPMRIVPAVRRLSATTGGDAERMLRDAYPMLAAFIRDGLLVDARSPEARRLTPGLRPGRRVAGAAVVRCVSCTVDTEVYELRAAGIALALKMVRRGAAATLRLRLLDHEARVLAHLAGGDAPRLAGRGTLAGRPYLLLSWCGGATLDVAARRLRVAPDAPQRLHRLAVAVSRAYATLHARGVLHGDVHPRNILVAADGSVTLVDFALARLVAAGAAGVSPDRGAAVHFYAPEQAAALAGKRPLPEPSAAAEQYAVAAAIYQALAGGWYAEFGLRERRLLEDIVTKAPIPFVRHGAAAWPAIEAVLARALAKRPADRFPATEAFARALASASPPRAPAIARRTPERWLSVAAAPGGRWWRECETDASVYSGAAGVACALVQVACASDDPRLLALADVWLARAERTVASAADGAPPPASLYGGAAGVFVARVQHAHALGDPALQSRAVGRLLRTVGRIAGGELLQGAAGTLLACALARDALLPDVGAAALDASARQLSARLGRAVARRRTAPGVAHGQAGVLFALLRWGRATTGGMPPRLRGLLARVAVGLDGPAAGGTVPGWCRGSAGFVQLFTLAHQLDDDPAWLAAAVRAAHDTRAAPGAAWDLCCGWTGRAYALLALYRRTGEEGLLRSASDFAQRATRACRSRFAGPPHGLFTGIPGVTALLADLERPAYARMPMFE